MDTSTVPYADPLQRPYAHQDSETSKAQYQSFAQPGAKPHWLNRLISPLSSVSPPNSGGDLRDSSSTMSSHMSNPIRSAMGQAPWGGAPDIPQPRQPANGNGEGGNSTLVLIFIPVMVVILTVLLGLVVFLIAVLYMRRRKGIRLTEDGGPLDLSKGDGVIGEGGVEGVEARWLETVDPEVKEAYKRAKDWQLQYPPASVPTDITLSQFLSIQEKGVSAWAFEPDYEDNLSLYVQSRTEITFLADGPGMPAREGGGNSVMANLPLPKLNEVYYWEVKMYDKPPNTEVAIGLATKPYPSFRLPGWNKHSIAYFASDGFKSHNYPFTGSSYGPPLAEGDVLGVGYRPRTGTVFFTRNGRKMDDAYTGLQQLNLFPTVGANGPCTIHVNLGQSGFVFIEANVKKWGLAPMVGTLAPPPAYGSERGSILLDAGYGTPGANRNTANLGGVNALLEAARVRSAARLGTSAGSSTTSLHGRAVQMESPRTPNSSRRHRRAGRRADLAGSVPTVSSPLRASEAGPGPSTVGSRRRALGRAANDDGDGTTHISPTDTPSIEACVPSAGGMEYLDSADDGEDDDEDADFYDDALTSPARDRETSPIEHNPPTPNLLDISMHSLRNGGHYFGTHYAHDGESGDGNRSGESDETARPSRLTLGPARMSRTNSSPPPPGYAPLDPHVYASGLPGDLPEELVNQAIAAMSEGDQGSGSSATDPQTQNHEQNSNEGTRGALGWWGFGSGSRRG